jgi:hypothetical protein
MHCLVICYGSKDSDPLGDERYGRDQRRLEIDLRLKLPRPGMSAREIGTYTNTWLMQHYHNIKHRLEEVVCSEKVRNSGADG